ncbi:MAG: hypothetical protein NVSMB16_10580 [Acidimicrobiales bacterium]
MAAAGPLEGLTVLDLGQIYNGAYAGLLLALGGARVIKIEPREGENLRRRGTVGGAGYPFVMLNSNKDGVTLNLKHPRGRELFLELVSGADVVLENFTPGTMDKLGIGSAVLRELNPRLIYAAGSGFGRTGPYKDFPAMDLTVQAIGGIMSTTGYPDRPPVKAGPAVCDFFAGIHLYAGIVTALYQRERTGCGEVVEVTMQEAVYPSLMSSLGLLFGTGGSAPDRTGNRHSGMAESPYNVYPTADGYVAIICVSEAHWCSLTEALGQPELAHDIRFATLGARVDRMDEVDEIVSMWTICQTKDHVVAELRAGNVPCAPVKDLAEVVADPNLWARGMLQRVNHPELGEVIAPHSPMRFGDGDRSVLRPSPALGEHNGEVFGGLLHHDADTLAQLVQDGVI